MTEHHHNTPYSFALMNDRTEVARFLRENGGLTYEEMLRVHAAVEQDFEDRGLR